MIWIGLGIVVAWIAFGPWVPVAAALVLCVPRARWWVQDRIWIDRRRGGIAAGVLAALVALVVAVPDGWLPIPPAPGVLVGPDYVGRPAAVRPVGAAAVVQNPHLARNGAGSRHGDATASGTSPWSGPTGLEPEVDTGWFGLEPCRTLAFDSEDRLVAWCSDRSGQALHVIEPASMRKQASKDLPDPGEDVEAAYDPCAGGWFYLDVADRAVVATSDRRILAIRTADADGEPDLTTDQAWDLSADVPADDCVLALLPDWAGRIWFTTAGGLVGTLTPDSGEVRTLDLDEQIATALTTDETGGAYVVTTHALHRLSAGPDGTPVVDWRTEYDRGSEKKSGQPAQGSGTPPTIIDGGIVAIADNAEPRMNVVFHERSSGREICRQPVFEPDASATGSALVSVGDGVIVQNTHGYGSRLATLLGRAPSPGLARVDVAGGACQEVWTSPEIAPSGSLRLSSSNGLAYAYTKKPSWWGVSAWYVTGVDVATGRSVFSVRTGTGTGFDNNRAGLAIAPDGAAWVPTTAGLVRVRDRVRD